jgi:hypothetical protein
MELRLAFGPGTRLWAYRSREELCYDWLHFKARRADASFKEFALVLYAQEKEYGLHCASLSAIRRGVAMVLKAHRVHKRSRALPAIAGMPRAGDGPAAQHDRGRQTVPIRAIRVAPVVYPDADRFPLRQNEVAR